MDQDLNEKRFYIPLSVSSVKSHNKKCREKSLTYLQSHAGAEAIVTQDANYDREFATSFMGPTNGQRKKSSLL